MRTENRSSNISSGHQSARSSNHKKAPSKAPVRSRRSAQPASIGTVLTMIFCFPVGLFTMWKHTRWPRLAKSAVTLVVCAALLAVLLPATNPPEREIGGIYLVDESPRSEVQGPEAPADREVIEIYAPRYTAIILEPTVTPAPVKVYCNNGGTRYHSADCKYVTENTPDTTLTRAIEVGYTQCTECNAPSPY